LLKSRTAFYYHLNIKQKDNFIIQANQSRLVERDRSANTKILRKFKFHLGKLFIMHVLASLFHYCDIQSFSKIFIFHLTGYLLRFFFEGSRWPLWQLPSSAREGQTECCHLLGIANQQDIADQHWMVPGLAFDHREQRYLCKQVGGSIDQRQITLLR
jgi:hypothetical protein